MEQAVSMLELDCLSHSSSTADRHVGHQCSVNDALPLVLHIISTKFRRDCQDLTHVVNFDPHALPVPSWSVKSQKSQ